MTRWMLPLICVLLAMGAGCQKSSKTPTTRQVTPQDFVTQTQHDTAGHTTTATAGQQPPATSPVIGTPPIAGGVESVDSAPTTQADTATPPTSDVVYVTNAMVGQANGKPIFAMDVFEPVYDILVQKGAQMPRFAFREEVTGLIDGRLEEIIFEALIIGEAERNLAPQEKVGLRFMLDDQADELIRRWGEGSREKADAKLMELFNQSIEQRVDRYRQQLIIRRYVELKVGPKISVGRKDIERYYRTHPEEFQPSAKRTIRMIVVDGETDKNRVEKLLEEGTPFVEVAGKSYNRNRPDSGGMYGEVEATPGAFAPEALDEAVRTLAVGEHSQAIKVGQGYRWVYIDSETGGQHRELKDVQLEIRDRLRQQQYKLHTDRLRERMFTEGSYTNVDTMRMTLVEVAMSRFARPE